MMPCLPARAWHHWLPLSRLGLSPSPEHVKKLVREQSLLYHPDKLLHPETCASGCASRLVSLRHALGPCGWDVQEALDKNPGLRREMGQTCAVCADPARVTVQAFQWYAAHCLAHDNGFGASSYVKLASQLSPACKTCREETVQDLVVSFIEFRDGGRDLMVWFDSMLVSLSNKYKHPHSTKRESQEDEKQSLSVRSLHLLVSGPKGCICDLDTDNIVEKYLEAAKTKADLAPAIVVVSVPTREDFAKGLFGLSSPYAAGKVPRVFTRAALARVRVRFRAAIPSQRREMPKNIEKVDKVEKEHQCDREIEIRDIDEKADASSEKEVIHLEKKEIAVSAEEIEEKREKKEKEERERRYYEKWRRSGDYLAVGDACYKNVLKRSYLFLVPLRALSSRLVERWRVEQRHARLPVELVRDQVATSWENFTFRGIESVVPSHTAARKEHMFCADDEWLVPSWQPVRGLDALEALERFRVDDVQLVKVAAGTFAFAHLALDEPVLLYRRERGRQGAAVCLPSLALYKRAWQLLAVESTRLAVIQTSSSSSSSSPAKMEAATFEPAFAVAQEKKKPRKKRKAEKTEKAPQGRQKKKKIKD